MFLFRIAMLGTLALVACSKGDRNAQDSGLEDSEDTEVSDSGDTTPSDSGETGLPEGPPYNLCGEGRDSLRPAGTWADPVLAGVLVMVDRADTRNASEDQIDRYDCAPETGEQGPEFIYRFEAPTPGSFRAEVTDVGDADIDIHLLQNPEIVDGLATGCIDRAHETLVVEDLSAGEYWVVADTWSDTDREYPGEFTLAFEFVPDNGWTSLPLAEGLSWERLRHDNLAGGNQTVNVLRVALDAGFDLQPQAHNGCEKVAAVSEGLGAIGGINGGFFGSNCVLLDLLRADGTLYATNQTAGGPQRSLGWNDSKDARFSWVDQGADWPEVANAMGGYPSLVTDGVVRVEAAPAPKHPRSALGLTESGDLLLMSVDGRTSAGIGMTTSELGQILLDLGVVNAANLDGGGSTTLVVKDCWIGDVVNHPSDNGSSDHHGARPVGSGLYIR
jgi:hypothetical protein